MSLHVCTSSDMHPYECTHDKFCEHCTWAILKGHNPKECALCQDMGQLVKEPFATRIRVNDYSVYRQKIVVVTAKALEKMTPKIDRQQRLPF